MNRKSFKIIKKIIVTILIGIFILCANKTVNAKVNVEEIQNNNKSINLKITSDKTIKDIYIYKKNKSGNYRLFFKILNQNTNERICKISYARLLQSDKEYDFKIKVIENDKTSSEIEFKAKRPTSNANNTTKPSNKPSNTPNNNQEDNKPSKPSITPDSTQENNQQSKPSTTPSNNPENNTPSKPNVNPDNNPENNKPNKPEGNNGSSSTKPIYKYPKNGKVVKSYSNDSINVSVEKISKYYVTKVWVKDPSKQIKKKEAGWGTRLSTVNSMLNNTENAIIGCNGSGFYKKR